MNDLILRNAAIFTAEPDRELFRGYAAVKDGLISRVGSGEPPADLAARETRDLGGGLLTPGLIDPHSHLIFGGSRANELMARLGGSTYMELDGTGGIRASVRATREASDEVLLERGRRVLGQMLELGVTTLEAKSGYGLDLETELRQLRLARELGHKVSIVTTYLGAHATPYDMDHDDYIRFMMDDVMPEVKRQGLAEFVDVFCEEGVFSIEETRALLTRSRELGFGLKMHADEIVSMGGAELAAELGCTSADHLMAISDEGIRRMKDSRTVAVLLPCTSFCLMSETWAPARRMLDEGLTVAIATDYNPGSTANLNIQFAMTLACYEMGLLPDEILRAVTVNAALALGLTDRGIIAAGKRADLVAWEAPDPVTLFYWYGQNLVREVWAAGESVVCREV